MANAIGDVWRCILEWKLDAEKATVVLHREVTEVTDQDEDVMGLAVVAKLVIEGDLITAAMLGTNAVLVCATAQRINEANPTRIYTEFSTGTPSLGGTSLPAQDAVLMSSYGDPGSEIKSGRTFMPFFDSGKQLAGQILASVVSGVENAITGITLDEFTLVSVGNLRAVLWRKATDLLPAVVVPVISNVLRPVIASQRRRVVHHQPFDV